MHGSRRTHVRLLARMHTPIGVRGHGMLVAMRLSSQTDTCTAVSPRTECLKPQTQGRKPSVMLAKDYSVISADP